MTKTCRYCGGVFDEESETFELRTFYSYGKDCEYFDTPVCLVAYIVQMWTVDMTRISAPKVQARSGG